MGMSERQGWVDQFPGNFQWSNAFLVCKGMAPYGAVALGEIDRVAQRLADQTVDASIWRDEWCALARQVEEQARMALDQGRRETAGNYFLRAGNYYYTGERFVMPGHEKLTISKAAFDCYHRGIGLRHPDLEFVEVPYGDMTLPALFLKATNTPGPAPTVVIFNGMDNCKEMSVLFAGLEFARRGFHTLAIDGPGQGESLRLRDIRARYDYEVAGTAAYEFLAGRSDVDSRKIALIGYSFGGYYACRIAAFERRYAAAVALTAPHQDLAAWQTKIKERTQTDGKQVAQSNFQFQWVVGASNQDEAIDIARKFDVNGIAGAITCPFLVTHGANDRIIPAGNAPKLYEAIGTDRKTLKIFHADEGGAEHAHVDNRQVGIDFAADWITAALDLR